MLELFRQRMRKQMEEQGYTPAPKFEPTFKLSQLVDIEVDGIDTSDFPDFCDAFIASAAVETWDGEYRELTDEEIDWINDECSDFVSEQVYEHIF